MGLSLGASSIHGIRPSPARKSTVLRQPAPARDLAWWCCGYVEYACCDCCGCMTKLCLAGVAAGGGFEFMRSAYSDEANVRTRRISAAYNVSMVYHNLMRECLCIVDRPTLYGQTTIPPSVLSSLPYLLRLSSGSVRVRYIVSALRVFPRETIVDHCFVSQ